ncbi:DUF6963 family protein [Thalassobaculum sp.]|uniref:DUF6963 family protein n=1 Tax=Thalassobaculum sp. TaxID=2022740 RepID=UPI003B5B3F85
MTIGIGAFGRKAGAAVLAAWAEAERRATGSLHGFAVFTVLGTDGAPVSLECQRGGLATIREQAEALARMAEAEVAGVITSGPDRSEPLSQFLAAGRAGLVTGHRLPNLATADGPPANRAALALLEKGLAPRHAVEAVLDGNPGLDAGLIAVTRSGIGLADSAHVQGRDDLGRALIFAEDRRYGLGLLHNSITPIDGLAAAVAAAGEAVLRRA